MKQFRSIAAVLIMFITLLVAFGPAMPAAALTLSSTQEIKVTAVVPGHRDIIVNAKGDIIEITSNTLEDLVPQVYLSAAAPQNQRDLTPALYDQYRKLVPEGTAKRGTLYAAKSPVILALTTSKWGPNS